ncbi:MAG: glycosyltransferase, partial [Clostridia bacterium]|nr:glycosyltransferase [Clostridia bacterium]
MITEKVAVIIPAYKPDEKLLGTLSSLADTGFQKILVIDDVSGAEFEPIFEQVKTIQNCILLRHEVNRGKGAALKTAFRYFLDNLSDMEGVVTADADGQHLTKDIIATAEKMIKTGKVVLGCRDFSQKDVPARSRNGNRITSAVFKIF